MWRTIGFLRPHMNLRASMKAMGIIPDLSRERSCRLSRESEKLRDRLAHSQQDLVEGTTWHELIDLVKKMEALVHRSDDEVEQSAQSSKKDGPSSWTVS